jgi:hypothetical protein
LRPIVTTTCRRTWRASDDGAPRGRRVRRPERCFPDKAARAKLLSGSSQPVETSLCRLDPQKYRPNIFDASTAIDQDIRQVWFAGVHADVGGGYPEEQSGLSKYPLLWMIAQAQAAGLRIDDSMVNHLGWGMTRPGSTHQYVKPDPAAQLHVSLEHNGP